MEILSELTAFGQILLIDLSLAGDNAIIVGMAAAGLPQEQRKRAIMIGIVAATVLRIIFAIFTVQLLAIIGLTLAGGLMLVWVSWKMYQELRSQQHKDQSDEASSAQAAPPAQKTLGKAVTQIIIADVSMSLDNVLAVAGAARDHMWVLIVGLALSVVLMGAAASYVVRLLHNYRWIGFAGLLVVLYVALRMIWEGGNEVVTFMGK